MPKMTWTARAFVGSVVAVGGAIFLIGLNHWHSASPLRFLAFLAVTTAISGMKVSLPGVTGTMSVAFLPTLVAITTLGLPEALVLGVVSTIGQCLWQAKRRPRAVQVLFNAGSSAIAIAASYATYHHAWLRSLNMSETALLVLSSLVYFLFNTGLVAVIIGLTERKSPVRIWRQVYFWCLPHYLVAASFLSICGRWISWSAAVAVLPIVYLILRSYRIYLGRLEDEKVHAEQVASLHLRTIEALALAIDAKDHTTHDHLQRVQVYAMELARELQLPEQEKEAVQAAALLHDIGKLAVPEHIISKPGKLTPEEFEKMKIHPVVGAEILERVQFPYPVSPVVRYHHEKWDGSGYPEGLKGEAIPIGARIISAVDCLDALASDRQYRRALPLDKAMAMLEADAGKAFDPRVIAILSRRYRELEEKARAGAPAAPVGTLSTEVKVERGDAPGAGFEQAASGGVGNQAPFLDSIGAARQEAQTLLEIAQALGSSLSLDETLSMVADRLKTLVPFEAMGVYLVNAGTLQPTYVAGTGSRMLASLRIPLGEGLSGWVAENRKPIVNGNPAVEPGYLQDPRNFSTLNSAISVPLETGDEVVGVLTLYDARGDAFSRDQLRVLLAISAQLAVAVRNARKYEAAEMEAATDHLTALPNARALYCHLQIEVERCSHEGSTIAVLVADLDGFKEVNDLYGHMTGDRVLAAVAARLRGCCREADYVARMGGDEFVLVLPGLTEELSAARIREFQRAVRQAEYEACGRASISISIGAAFYPRDGKNAKALLAHADGLMYAAKPRRNLPAPALIDGEYRNQVLTIQ